MYYVKWKGDKDKWLKVIELGRDPWDKLSAAKGFASALEALSTMGPGSGCMHWLAMTEIIFIHPLNFEARIRRTS